VGFGDVRSQKIAGSAATQTGRAENQGVRESVGEAGYWESKRPRVLRSNGTYTTYRTYGSFRKAPPILN